MTDMNTPRISITNYDPREIDNLQITVWFQINGQTYFDYEAQGTFNNIQTNGLTGLGGTWNGSQWVGNFLHKTGSQSLAATIRTIEKVLADTNSPYDVDYVNGGPVVPNLQIVHEDERPITKLCINAEFSIAGENYTDTLFLGDFNQQYGLALTGMGGTKGSNGWWTGSFLSVQYAAPNDTSNAPLRTFLSSCLWLFCVAGAIAAEGSIVKGFPIKGDPTL